MRYMKYLCYIFVFFLVISCQEKDGGKNRDFPHTNVDMPVDEVSGISAEFVDTVIFVKLHEPENSFGLLSKLQIYNDTIYILDKRLYKLMSFDGNGNFLTIYGERGKAKQEYLKATDFDVDDRFVYLYDRANKKMLYFTHSGQYVKSVNTEFRGEEFKVLVDGGFLFSLERETSRAKVCVTDVQFNVKTVYLAFAEDDKNNYSSASLFQAVGDSIYYTDDLSDTTYVFTRQGNMTSYYYFNFGSYSLPTDLRYDAEKLVSKMSDGKYVYTDACPLICGSTLIASLGNRNTRTVLYYDLEGRKGGNKNIGRDLSSTDIVRPLCFYGGCVVGSLEGYSLDRFADKSSLPQDVVEHIEAGNRVVVFYRLKR